MAPMRLLQRRESEASSASVTCSVFGLADAEWGWRLVLDSNRPAWSAARLPALRAQILPPAGSLLRSDLCGFLPPVFFALCCAAIRLLSARLAE